MTNVDIRISIPLLMSYNESLKSEVGEETLLLMIEDFSRYIMNLYGRLIEEAVNSSRYKGNWEPIEDEGYIEYLGTIPKVNILYLLKDALKVEKRGTNFIVTIDSTYRYPESKHKLIKIVRAIDAGTSKFNARPILGKITRQIRSHILQLWRGYLKMHT